MSKKVVFYIVFFTVLVIGFYFAMTKVIPEFRTVKLPILSYVQPFRFVNQDGQYVTNDDLAGKVYVTEFFFTTCKSICPIMNTNMQDVYKEFKDEPDFLILSHTCDPDNDSVPQLKKYADSLQVNTEKWIFVTGPKDSLYLAARNSYLLDDSENNLQNINDQFLHTQFFALVDKKGQVRKIVDGLKKDELQDLIRYIGVLLKEE